MDSRYMFSISKSVRNSNEMQPCTPELLNAAMDSQQVADTCKEIADKLQQVKEGTLTREAFEAIKAKLKAENLPVVCFHATFTDGHRCNQSAVPSGLSIYDMDHLTCDPREYYYNKVAGREVELGIDYAHVSPSKEGVRLVFEIPQGMTLAEAQQWMATQLGDETYDGCVKDLARCSFVVCRDYVLYYDEEELFAEREVSMAVTNETIVTPVSASLLPPADDQSFEDNFNGIKYPQIVRAMEDILGGVPAQGARNNFIFMMSCYLRYVCNDDPRWIAQVLPRYGEDEQKFVATVRSACNRPQTKTVPDVVTRALDLARKKQQIDEAVEASGIHAPKPPVMPEKLTKFMKLITKNVPAHLKPAVAMGVFPALGAHCKGVKFRYNDNALVEPTFMNILVAEMSSGKSCVNEPISAIMADIKEKDSKNRKLMKEYKEQYDTCPSDQQKPERPKGLCIQWVKSDMTPAAFVQLMADAGGRFLYTRMDEIGLLNQLKTNGKGNNVTEILRLAYDCGDYGQERVGTKSVCEDVQIRWNWNASTTPGKCRKFFGDAMLDGTLSRMSFCTIYTDDDRMPLYGIYDEKFQEQVQQAVAQLNDAKGLVVCRKANALAAAMIEENRQYSALADDDVYRELSYRATLSAFKRGMVLYLLNGQKWCKEIEDFVRWSYHYDMWCKMWIFGEKMRRAMDLDKAVMLPGRRNLMEFLQDSFTLDDLNTVRRAQGMKDDGSAQLRKWLSRGYCTFNPATQQYTKSAQFLEKHQKAA
ncbi:VirE N-terminal domain-containing protein [Prevotella communis]|uniref:VirE N-terminal domain-containing protein n=1 Tax=Prevotella communis TaxID=2913614 RepID=A0A1G7WXJ2_9BACT|nr:DUF3987 domain-containing protein [Prevotella communis]SDG76616.1 VirE N-terminal domain-containing protein [Prevotella communis]